jgi:hypothetical protein
VTSTQLATQELRDALKPHGVFTAPTIRDLNYLDTAIGLLPVATRSTVLQSTTSLRDALTDRLRTVCRELQVPLGVSAVTVEPGLRLDVLLESVHLNFNVQDGAILPVANLGQGHIS